ncbi:hypothetical protein niasHT_030699 [Heterodera trifolii]|uniref:Uncharacterized protein n=1 Tax=Heterodera trifolii TaxID=157864 RepID=A0ABD2HX64_9BILA
MCAGTKRVTIHQFELSPIPYCRDGLIMTFQVVDKEMAACVFITPCAQERSALLTKNGSVRFYYSMCAGTKRVTIHQFELSPIPYCRDGLIMTFQVVDKEWLRAFSLLHVRRNEARDNSPI